MKEFFTLVDASFAVHPNIQSHTGGDMSMGYGIIHSRSIKQKLNTESNTELDIFGTSEYVPFNIWIVIFYEAQGYELTRNFLFKDNESEINMDNNGRES